MYQFKPEVEAVEVCGTQAWVREITAGEQSRLFNRAEKDGDLPSLLVLFAACDSEGKRLYADADLEAVASLPARIVNALAKAASKLNGLDAKADTPKND